MCLVGQYDQCAQLALPAWRNDCELRVREVKATGEWGNAASAVRGRQWVAHNGVGSP